MKYNKSVYRTLALVTQLGISMLAPIFLCVFLGHYLDERFGWHSFIPLLLLGILAGCRNCYLIARHSNEDRHERKE